MAESIEAYIQEVEAFERTRAVVRALQIELKKPIPVVRKAIRARAIATLPKAGQLNDWVAAIKVTSTQETLARSVRVRLKGGRNSKGGRSDIKRLDAGRVRAPSWGRRTAASWHTVNVAPGFFTEPVTDSDEWLKAAERALDRATEAIR